MNFNFDKMQSDAAFTFGKTHRLWLKRIWAGEKPLVMFIGLNPSTANHLDDDPTIRRVKAMAASWGYGGVYMMNLFTFVSTDPSALNMAKGNVSNADEWLISIAEGCKTIVFAWGNFKVFGRDEQVKKMFPNAMALQINKNGSPKHPLYCKSDIKPIPYNHD